MYQDKITHEVHIYYKDKSNKLQEQQEALAKIREVFECLGFYIKSQTVEMGEYGDTIVTRADLLGGYPIYRNGKHGKSGTDIFYGVPKKLPNQHKKQKEDEERFRKSKKGQKYLNDIRAFTESFKNSEGIQD